MCSRGRRGERGRRTGGHLSALAALRGGRTEATCSPRPGGLRNILRAFFISPGHIAWAEELEEARTFSLGFPNRGNRSRGD